MSARSMTRLVAALFVFRALLAPGLAQAGAAATVSLDAKALTAAELKVQSLKPARYAPRIAGFGLVLDPAPLAARSAELAGARGKLAASQAKVTLAAAEEARTQTLYRARQNVALAVLQKTQAQLAVAKADRAMAAAALAEIKARIRAKWGTRLAAAIASNGDPLPALEGGAVRLVQVSLPLGASFGSAPQTASAIAPDGTPLGLRFLARSPQAAPRVGGQVLFYLMEPTPAAPIGTPLQVALASAAPESGVVVPRSAVVWNNGQAFVYREVTGNRFDAVAIGAVLPVAGGYFVPGQVLPPGTKIVTGGAALLLSAQLSAKSPKAAKPDED